MQYIAGMQPTIHQEDRMTPSDPHYSTALDLAIELLCSVALSCVLFLLILGVMV